MKSLFVTQSAHQTIKDVSRRCSLETGSVLVGLLSDPMIILGAGQPGPKAVHHPVRFTTDPTADLECLSTCRQRYGLIAEILGWFHKHYGLQSPSGGDHNQAAQLIEEFDDNRPVLMGIYCESGLFRKNTTLRFFALSADRSQTEYKWEIIADDSPEIEKAIQNIPSKPEITDTHFWNDAGFQSYANPVGRQRILKEIKDLRSHSWHTTTYRSKNNNGLIIELMNPQDDIRLLMPPEFPLNAPMVITGNNRRVRHLKTVSEWNSTTTLLDIVTEVYQILSCPLCRVRHLETI